MGEPERSGLLTAAMAVEILHTATLIHDDVVDKAESRRGKPAAVAGYGGGAAVATGDYPFSETLYGVAQIGDPRLVGAFAEGGVGLGGGGVGRVPPPRGPAAGV